MAYWKRMLIDFGWAMAMTDPTCYSYYLASRVDEARDAAPAHQDLPQPRYDNRARPTVVCNTGKAS
jgi:hypothetical protein